MDKTKLILSMSKELSKEEMSKKAKDLKKINKFLIRQTLENEDMIYKMSFLDFLYEVGMFETEKELSNYSKTEIDAAKQKYYDALSASIHGTGAVILKRDVKDIFTNGYNKSIMRLHQANHDLQVVIDQYACAQYVCGYLTKNEAGMSKLLKAVNEESNNIKQMEKLNKLSAVLDKHR